MANTSERRRTLEQRLARLLAVRTMASGQGGVVSRDQLRAAGISVHEVDAQVRAHRWRPVHTQSIATHTGPLGETGRMWAAVFEAGPRGCLDGVSALLAAGLKHYSEETIRVSIPRGVLARRAPGVLIRQTRRLVADDLVAPGWDRPGMTDPEAAGSGPVIAGIPRTRPAVAGVRAGLWAVSDKQAALLPTMAVQQGLTTPEQLAEELLRVRRDRRRLLITAVVTDLVGGVRSLGEHEFAHLCRRYGLPEPSRQTIRRGKGGRYYLDVCWEEWGVVVEIDGIQHEWAGQVVADALRHNAIALERSLVLRLPLLGLRVAPDQFFAQIQMALASRGCPLDAAGARVAS